MSPQYTSDMQALLQSYQGRLLQGWPLSKDILLNMLCNCSNCLEVMPCECNQRQLRELVPRLICTQLLWTCAGENCLSIDATSCFHTYSSYTWQ